MRIVLAVFALFAIALTARADEIEFSGSAESLQKVINEAKAGSIIICNGEMMQISKTIRISKPLTLRGLQARLPE